MADPVIAQPPVENPVLKPEDAKSSDLLKMAQEADAQRQAEESGQPVTTVATTEVVKPAAPVVKVDEKPVTGPARDDQGRFTKADGTKSEPNEVAPVAAAAPVKPESEFTKKQKESARKEKTWQELHDERQQIARERAEWQAQKDREAAERAKPTQPQPDKYSSKQLFSAADSFLSDARAHKAAGNHEEAAESAELATQARIAGQAALDEENKTTTQRQQEDFTKTWQGNASAYIKEVPELGDPKSELSQEMNQLFNREPMLNFHPEGLRVGHRILRGEKALTMVDTLEAKVTELESEVARLRGATELGGAPPAPQTHSKTFDDLTSTEMSKALGRMAEEADASRAA